MLGNIRKLLEWGYFDERPWRGNLAQGTRELDSVEAVLKWASNMTCKGIKPIVHLVENTYEKGVKVLSNELKHYQPFWHRSETLPKWDITIIPT